MASHKQANAGVVITSVLQADELAQLCQTAADTSARKSTLAAAQHVRLEEAKPGRLRFSLRTMGGKREQMVFDVDLATQSDRNKLSTKIMHYKTHQQKFLHIPMGPKRMMGIQTYQQFLANLEAQVRAKDPSATCQYRS